ncbi:hypothetical protein SNL152K_1139 [Streptomyces sp. NL15-2K]|nr:hypothetical protein SNL152K_1139 [Streptomyces sp. NL15-2K]
MCGPRLELGHGRTAASAFEARGVVGRGPGTTGETLAAEWYRSTTRRVQAAFWRASGSRSARPGRSPLQASPAGVIVGGRRVARCHLTADAAGGSSAYASL